MDWRKVPDHLKNAMWGEVKKHFSYPEGYDEELCKSWVLVVAGKALRRLRSHIKVNYVQKGKTPFTNNTFIKHKVWDEFVAQVSTDEAKTKGSKL